MKMTQDEIANLLGVRREGVTLAAGRLQKAGLIEYARGRIAVLDRPCLESRPANATSWSSVNSIACCPM